MTDLEKIYKQIDKSKPAMIEMLKVLNGIPAIAPESGGDGETEKAKALVDQLRKLGIDDIQQIGAPDDRVSSGERPNIIATIPGTKKDQNFWVMTHLDVVPPGDESLWETPPFEAREIGGKLFGRGCEDNGQSMVASIFATAALLAQEFTPQRTVKLLFVADEEVGSDRGIHYLLEHHSLFKKNDFILAPDMGNPDGSIIEIAEKNLLWLRFKTAGKQCHASTPQNGVNAFVAGSELVLSLHNLNRMYSERNELFDPPVSTFSPTKKENNIPNINTIPTENVFYMDCRILPDIDIQDVEDKVQAAIDSISQKHGVEIDYSVVTRASSLPTPGNTPLVTALKRAIKCVYAIDARLVGIGGGTVAAPLRNAGFDTVVWSKIQQTAHMPNEFCLVDNMVGEAKVMAAIMLTS